MNDIKHRCIFFNVERITVVLRTVTKVIGECLVQHTKVRTGDPNVDCLESEGEWTRLGGVTGGARESSLHLRNGTNRSRVCQIGHGRGDRTSRPGKEN